MYGNVSRVRERGERVSKECGQMGDGEAAVSLRGFGAGSDSRIHQTPGTNRIDRQRAVKAFHRPAAGNDQPLPSDVRPPEVLKVSAGS